MSKSFGTNHSYSQSQFGGTIPYQAPEILKNLPYGRKVDVYAFGILMYEVLTDSFAYPELESGKISDLEFRNKVANENYRPNFQFQVNESLQELVEQCLLPDPKERPSFEVLFKKLAGLDESNPKDYFLDDVDRDEFDVYIGDITEVSDKTDQLLQNISVIEDANKQLKKENEKLKAENEHYAKKNCIL